MRQLLEPKTTINKSIPNPYWINIQGNREDLRYVRTIQESLTKIEFEFKRDDDWKIKKFSIDIFNGYVFNSFWGKPGTVTKLYDEFINSKKCIIVISFFESNPSIDNKIMIHAMDETGGDTVTIRSVRINDKFQDWLLISPI